MKDTFTMRIAILHREFFRYAEERLLKETGLKWGSVPFILHIGKHPGCTHSELTKSLHLDWGYSQRAIVKLEAGGYIRREINKENGNTLTLLEDGEKAFRIAHDVFSSFDEELLSQLDENERKELMKIMNKLQYKDRRNERV